MTPKEQKKRKKLLQTFRTDKERRELVMKSLELTEEEMEILEKLLEAHTLTDETYTAVSDREDRLLKKLAQRGFVREVISPEDLLN